MLYFPRLCNTYPSICSKAVKLSKGCVADSRQASMAAVCGVVLQSLMGLLVNTIPTLIPVASFLAYLLLMRQPLSAAQAFTALSLFNILRFPLFQLPQILTQVRPTWGLQGYLYSISNLGP